MATISSLDLRAGGGAWLLMSSDSDRRTPSVSTVTTLALMSRSPPIGKSNCPWATGTGGALAAMRLGNCLPFTSNQSSRIGAAPGAASAR